MIKITLIFINAIYLIIFSILAAILIMGLMNNELSSQERIFSYVVISLAPLFISNAMFITRKAVKLWVKIPLLVFNLLFLLVSLAIVYVMVNKGSLMTAIIFAIFGLVNIVNFSIYFKKHVTSGSI